MLSKFRCSVSGHRIAKNRVWHDQLSFRTSCSRCGIEMIRVLGGWRAFDEKVDGNELRMAQPKRSEEQAEELTA